MKQATRARLAELNSRFYAQQARAFDATRRAMWPGLSRALAHALPALARGGHDPRQPLRVLDLGCGNGRALPVLQRHCPSGLRYLGVDGSPPLLAIATERFAHEPHARFAPCDLTLTQAASPALPAGPFDLVLLLGVLHCVASEDARRALLTAAAVRVASPGAFVLTAWRFERDRRLSRRRLSPAQVRELAPELDCDDLEPGDALLGFGDAPRAIRYCHFFDEAELLRLLGAVPLAAQLRFAADGAGDQLNDYFVLMRAAQR